MLREASEATGQKKFVVIFRDSKELAVSIRIAFKKFKNFKL